MLDEIEASMGYAQVELPGRGVVTVDGLGLHHDVVEAIWLPTGEEEPARATTPQIRIMLAPGAHRIVWRSGGEEISRQIELEARETLRVLLERPRTKPVPAPTSAVEPWRFGFAIGFAALGAANLAAGTILAVRAADRWRDARAVCPAAQLSGLCPDGRGPTLANMARNDAQLSTLGFGIGAAATASALLLGILSLDSGLHVRPGPGDIGLMLSFQR